ncbi:MAG: flagellar FliJ family protein, partial [Gammaproteobacteria bacterium]
MKKSQRIHRIAGLASTEQRIAAQALAAAQRELNAQQGQLANLRHYHADYLRRLGDGNALSGYEAQKLRVFAQRIEQVVAGLARRVDASERRVERERLRMLGHQRRANA